MATDAIVVLTRSAIIANQGHFNGRTFKSKEDFLRELRGGKSEPMSPKSGTPLNETAGFDEKRWTMKQEKFFDFGM